MDIEEGPPERPESESPRTFKVHVEAATDWSDARGIPVTIERDKEGFWFATAHLEDVHGTFRAVVSIMRFGDMFRLLDETVAQVRAERRNAFRGKKPGHLKVPT